MDYVKSKALSAGGVKTPYRFLITAFSFITIIVAALIYFSNVLELPIEQLTADPAVSFNAHPVTGIGSYIGMIMWCTAAVVCLFSAAFLKVTGNETDFLFLLCSGLLSLMLLIDDAFMFHEAIFPWYFHLPQYAVYAGYMLITLAYLFYFRKHILNSEYLILALALLLFGASVAGDFVLPQEGLAYLVEDAFKLFGLAAWMVYFVWLSLKRISG